MTVFWNCNQTLGHANTVEWYYISPSTCLSVDDCSGLKSIILTFRKDVVFLECQMNQFYGW